MGTVGTNLFVPINQRVRNPLSNPLRVFIKK